MIKRTVAFAGNPNVGKSTVFNCLTGLSQHTGNWPGKTVDVAQGTAVFEDIGFTLVDLPGSYSLLSHSAEEEIARDFVCFAKLDAVVAVCDASCLERNMNLVLQIIEAQPKTIVCLNLMDEAEKKKIRVDLERLSGLLRVPVVGCAARSGQGMETLLETVARVADPGAKSPDGLRVSYQEAIERAIAAIEPLVSEAARRADLPERWVALRLLEGDVSLLDSLERHTGIGPWMAAGTSIDARRIKTESGTTEDALRDALIDIQKTKSETTEVTRQGTLHDALIGARKALSESGITDDTFRDAIVKDIFMLSSKICAEVVRFEDKAYNRRQLRADRLLTSRVTGVFCMLLLLAAVFWITLVGANRPSDWLHALFRQGEGWLTSAFEAIGCPGWLHGLLIMGAYRVATWVVAVMLPPMAIFFPLFTLLEDVGYLPRVAFNLDRSFQRNGACGKQALTMSLGFGCNACGVTGCRIIDSRRERLIAILTNSFVPCNGRFPLLIAIAAMFLATAGNPVRGTIQMIGNLPGEIILQVGTPVSGAILTAGNFTTSAVAQAGNFAASTILPALSLTGLILLGVGMTLFCSRLLSKTLLKGQPSSFTLELPPYRRPRILPVIVRSMLDRTLFVLGRAVVVAFPAGAVIWALSNITAGGDSLLLHMTRFLDPAGRFLGMDGVILAAFILGFPANEIVLPIALMAYASNGTLSELPGLMELKAVLVQNGWTALTALCVVLFSLMHWPCSTTCLTIKKETGSLRWTAAAVLLPTAFGVVICAVVAGVARLVGRY